MHRTGGPRHANPANLVLETLVVSTGSTAVLGRHETSCRDPDPIERPDLASDRAVAAAHRRNCGTVEPDTHPISP